MVYKFDVKLNIDLGRIIVPVKVVGQDEYHEDIDEYDNDDDVVEKAYFTPKKDKAA